MKYFVYVRDFLEEFNSKNDALDYISDLLDDYDLDEFTLIEGRELKIKYKVEAD